VLPPTESSLKENILRAHYQTAIWKSCTAQDPPTEDPQEFGWYFSSSGLLLPKMLHDDSVVAPSELLNMIRCNCQAATNRCDHGRCTCKEANIKCTSFCGCMDDEIVCHRFQDSASDVNELDSTSCDISDCEISDNE